MKDCLTLHQIAECCGACRITVCEQPDDHLNVNIIWSNDHDTVSETSVACQRSCRALHDVLIEKGVEMELADQVCTKLDLG